MIRSLHTYPGPVEFDTLLAELRAVVSDVRGCNDVAGMVAVYTDGPQDEAAIGTVVAGHMGPQPAAPDPLHQLAQAIVDATTLDDVKPAAQAILGDGQ